MKTEQIERTQAVDRMKAQLDSVLDKPTMNDEIKRLDMHVGDVEARVRTYLAKLENQQAFLNHILRSIYQLRQVATEMNKNLPDGGLNFQFEDFSPPQHVREIEE